MDIKGLFDGFELISVAVNGQVIVFMVENRQNDLFEKVTFTTFIIRVVSGTGSRSFRSLRGQ